MPEPLWPFWANLEKKAKQPRHSKREKGHSRASALVVDVVVASSEAEEASSLDGSGAVVREDAAGEGVSGRLVDELAGLLELVVLVDVDSQDGAKDLVDHGRRARVLGQDDGRLDEVTSRVVADAAGEHFAARLLGLLDVAEALVVRALRAVRSGNEIEEISLLSLGNFRNGSRNLHDRAHEVAELGDGADSDLADLGEERLLELALALPKRLGNVQPRESRALLACKGAGSSAGSLPCPSRKSLKTMTYPGTRKRHGSRR